MSLIKLIRVGYCLMCGVFASVALSHDKLYQCTVKQVLEIDEGGYLKPIGDIGATRVGSTFTINRSTGEVWGKSISTKYADALKIVDKGGDSNNFKISAVINHLNSTHFFIEVVDYKPKLEYSFSGYFKFNHIAGLCK